MYNSIGQCLIQVSSTYFFTAPDQDKVYVCAHIM